MNAIRTLLLETFEKLTILCHPERSEESNVYIIKKNRFFTTLRMTIIQMLLLIILTLLFLPNNAYSKKSSSIESKKIYTLKKDEFVAYDESYLYFNDNKFGWLILINNDGSNKVKVLVRNYNGKSYDLVVDDIFDVVSFGNSISYIIRGKNDKNFIYKNGKKWGPYKNIYVTHFIELETESVGLPCDNIAYEVEKNDLIYMLINDKLFGPYEEVNDKIFLNSKSWIFSYIKKEKSYVNISGIDYGPFDEVSYPALGRNGDSILISYSYSNDDKIYLSINDKKFGPYLYLNSLDEMSDSLWFYNVSSDEGVSLINNQGKEIGPYENINKVEFESTYSYDSNRDKQFRVDWSYIIEKENEDFLLTNSSKEYGPYPSIIHEAFYINKDKIVYSVMDKDSMFYIMLNTQKIYKLKNNNIYSLNSIFNYPYFSQSKNGDNFFIFFTEDSAKYAISNTGKKFGPYYSFSKLIGNECFEAQSNKDGKYYIIIDNKEYGPYNLLGSVSVTSSNSWAFEYKNDNLDFINFNNKILGPYENVEDLKIINDYLIYTFEKDKKYYFVYNEKQFGPYNYIDDITIPYKRNHFAIKASNYEETFEFIDGNFYGPYSEITDFEFSSDGSKWYISYTKDSLEYILTQDNKNYGPYNFEDTESTDYSLPYSKGCRINNDDNLQITYEKKDGQYVIINDVEYGPNPIYIDFHSINGIEYAFWLSLKGKSIYFNKTKLSIVK